MNPRILRRANIRAMNRGGDLDVCVVGLDVDNAIRILARVRPLDCPLDRVLSWIINWIINWILDRGINRARDRDNVYVLGLDLDRAIRTAIHSVDRGITRLAYALTTSLVLALTRDDDEGRRGSMPLAGRLLTVATYLLPSVNRARYVAEFRSELWELAHVGASRRDQLAYAVRQIRSSLRLAVQLRVRRQRRAAP